MKICGQGQAGGRPARFCACAAAPVCLFTSRCAAGGCWPLQGSGDRRNWLARSCGGLLSGRRVSAAKAESRRRCSRQLLTFTVGYATCSALMATLRGGAGARRGVHGTARPPTNAVEFMQGRGCLACRRRAPRNWPSAQPLLQSRARSCMLCCFPAHARQPRHVLQLSSRRRSRHASCAGNMGSSGGSAARTIARARRRRRRQQKDGRSRLSPAGGASVDMRSVSGATPLRARSRGRWRPMRCHGVPSSPARWAVGGAARARARAPRCRPRRAARPTPPPMPPCCMQLPCAEARHSEPVWQGLNRLSGRPGVDHSAGKAQSVRSPCNLCAIGELLSAGSRFATPWNRRLAIDDGFRRVTRLARLWLPPSQLLCSPVDTVYLTNTLYS